MFTDQGLTMLAKKMGCFSIEWNIFMAPLNWNIDVIIRALYESLEEKGVHNRFFLNAS